MIQTNELVTQYEKHIRHSVKQVVVRHKNSDVPPKIKLSSSKMVRRKEIGGKNTMIQESDREQRKHFRSFCLKKNILNLQTSPGG